VTAKPLRLVVIESPFGSGVEVYKTYLSAALRDSYARGESPYASHAIGPLALDGRVPAERQLGLAAGCAWRVHAAATVVYEDFGLSRGMQAGIADSVAAGVPVEYRKLGGVWAEMYQRFQDESARKPIAPASGR
jgi:hypothetical protein